MQYSIVVAFAETEKIGKEEFFNFFVFFVIFILIYHFVSVTLIAHNSETTMK